MKKKLMICFLVLAMALGGVSALAVPKIDHAEPEAGKAKVVVENGGKSVSVKCENMEKDRQYVVMVVADDAIDESSKVPTKSSINNNQNHEVVFMDQAAGDSNGSVSFNVYPNLDNASAGDKFGIFLSGTGLDISKIGEFTTIEEVLRWLGDVNDDGEVDIRDVQRLLNNLIDEIELSGDNFKAANVNSTDAKITIADVQRLLNMIIDEDPKKAI